MNWLEHKIRSPFIAIMCAAPAWDIAHYMPGFAFSAPALHAVAANLTIKDLAFEIEYETNNYAEQRGLEEVLYNRHNAPLDKTRPVSDRKKQKAKRYRNAAIDYLRDRGLL